MKSISKILTFTFIIVLFIARAYFIKIESLQNNLFAIQLNKAYGSPELSWQERMKIYSQLLNVSSNSKNDSLTLINPQSELVALSNAIVFLQLNQLNFNPGKQLIYNPNFSHSMTGWTLFRSDWEITDAPNQSGRVISHLHKSSVNGHINQTLFLSTNRCYLFIVEGAIERYDYVKNIWLYWETYEKGNPRGNNLLSGHGSESWKERFGIFCLDQDIENQQKVTVAPINIYGNAQVELSAARIYELQRR